jgi:hypothetical protein
VDRPGLAELDDETVFALQQRGDDLFLHFAVQADGDVAALTDTDQRVLLGELRQCLDELHPVPRADDGLECRWCEQPSETVDAYAEMVADLDVLQPAERNDLTSFGRLDGTARSGREEFDSTRTSLVRRT